MNKWFQGYVKWFWNLGQRLAAGWTRQSNLHEGSEVQRWGHFLDCYHRKSIGCSIKSTWKDKNLFLKLLPAFYAISTSVAVSAVRGTEIDFYFYNREQSLLGYLSTLLKTVWFKINPDPVEQFFPRIPCKDWLRCGLHHLPSALQDAVPHGFWDIGDTSIFKNHFAG